MRRGASGAAPPLIGNDLAVRVVSGLAFGLVALAAAWFGGLVAGIVIALAAAIVYLEWSAITGTV